MSSLSRPGQFKFENRSQLEAAQLRLRIGKHVHIFFIQQAFYLTFASTRVLL